MLMLHGKGHISTIKAFREYEVKYLNIILIYYSTSMKVPRLQKKTKVLETLVDLERKLASSSSLISLKHLKEKWLKTKNLEIGYMKMKSCPQ